MHWKYFLAVFFAVNFIAYLMMWVDKMRAIQNKRRIPEKQLLLTAFLFGATGIFLGMKKPLYHKAAKSLFRILIPILAVIDCILVAWLFLR